MAAALSIFSEIKEALRSSFAKPDPMRFAHMSVTPWNWNGEFEKVEEKKGGAVLTNKDTRTFEFGGYADIEIPEHLTDLDIQGLRKFKLDPTNPAYAKCKKYFAKMPFCKKKELAANSFGDESLGEYFDGISIHTADKVLQAFNAFLIAKSTF